MEYVDEPIAGELGVKGQSQQAALTGSLYLQGGKRLRQQHSVFDNPYVARIQLIEEQPLIGSKSHRHRKIQVVEKDFHAKGYRARRSGWGRERYCVCWTGTIAVGEAEPKHEQKNGTRQAGDDVMSTFQFWPLTNANQT